VQTSNVCVDGALRPSKEVVSVQTELYVRTENLLRGQFIGADFIVEAIVPGSHECSRGQRLHPYAWQP
jgi:hypothetical protein